jgi:uncharacterized protein YdaU (DUF1376 family)
MSARPWMPLYIADYLADTAHLGAYQSGAYLHLIMHQWQHGGLPADERALCRIAKVQPPHWPRMRKVLAPFFGNPKRGGSWIQKRTALELTKATEISSKRKAAALQMHGKRTARAEQKQTQPQSQSQIGGGERAISSEAFDLTASIARLCGYDQQFIPPAWAGAPLTVQGWLNQGWSAEQVDAACREIMAGKRDGPPSKITYFEKGIARFVARLAQPLPKADPNMESVNGRKLSPYQQRLAERDAILEQRRRDRATGRPDGRESAAT